MAKIIFIVVCLLFLSACDGARIEQKNTHSSTLVYRSNWRAGIDPALSIQAPSRNSISTVALPQSGDVALMVSIKRSDDFSHVANGAPRAELVFAPIFRFLMGNEYDIQWSTMIPSGFQPDRLQPEVITQLHPASNSGVPVFGLVLTGNQYQVDSRGGPGTPVHTRLFGNPSDDKGKVVFWRLIYRPDDKGPQALTELYRNGERIMRSSGDPNAYPGDNNAYFKMGIYKWWWKSRPSDVGERTMYYGEVQIKVRAVTGSSSKQSGASASGN
jgi:hypothetical protein